jgi:subtilisin family serine protease
MRGFRPQHVPSGTTRLVRWNSALDGRDGRGLRIALLDGSAAFDHPDLVGAAIERADFAGPTAAAPGDAGDDPWHGTRDLLILVGQGRAQVRGLAPGAQILHARVLADDGGDLDALAAAIAWACAALVNVVVLPLGAPDDDAAVARELDRGLAAGICFVAAAGNGAPRPVDFPARHPGVLAVGATDERGVLLPSCCGGPRLDRLAPGTTLSRALPGSGSSVACVLAGGVEALLRATG